LDILDLGCPLVIHHMGVVMVMVMADTMIPGTPGVMATEDIMVDMVDTTEDIMVVVTTVHIGMDITMDITMDTGMAHTVMAGLLNMEKWITGVLMDIPGLPVLHTEVQVLLL